MISAEEWMMKLEGYRSRRRESDIRCIQADALVSAAQICMAAQTPNPKPGEDCVTAIIEKATSLNVDILPFEETTKLRVDELAHEVAGMKSVMLEIKSLKDQVQDLTQRLTAVGEIMARAYTKAHISGVPLTFDLREIEKLVKL